VTKSAFGWTEVCLRRDKVRQKIRIGELRFAKAREGRGGLRLAKCSILNFARPMSKNKKQPKKEINTVTTKIAKALGISVDNLIN
jgi:hypothetical protein